MKQCSMPRRPDPSWADPPDAPLSPPPDTLFHVVLFQPEIPNNTGNIGRTCVAVGADLHLIHPLGFDLSVKARRRAGLDYWRRLRAIEHADWDAYAALMPRRTWAFSTHSATPYFNAEFRRGDHLLFGRETSGLPDDVLAALSDRVLTIPMLPGERSLNLATAVCAVLYEGVRQLLARGELSTDERSRLIPAAGPSR
jgi:tRNA (cytidine/uridine-2'-O-)-methyltransferase